MKFLFYGGKGGVGKTTLAAARAVRESRRSRVLVISTDPAHSLGDALGVRLSSTPRWLSARLAAVELDAPRALKRWLKDHHRTLSQILERGTMLDRDDVDALMELSIPGVDELVGLMEIARLARRRIGSDIQRHRPSQPLRSTYDIVIVDTAPTGHTLRLLAAPDTVSVVASVLDALQEDHRIIRDQLARVGRGPDAADRFIAALADQARETADRLRSGDTAFHWITLPERLSIAESEDALRALDASGVRVDALIVNRVLPDGPPCPVCDRRRAEERRAIATIRAGIGRRRAVHVVRAEITEPRGMKALARLTIDTAQGTGNRATKRVALRPVLSALRRGDAAITAESIAAIHGASLIFFGGKGGVGKTTVAAATALRLARADRHRRVLLLSTDPANSLSDVLRTAIGDEPSQVPRAPANLVARELDATRALERKRADLEAAFSEMAGALGTGDAGAGASRAAELMRLAPPGIDELFGIVSVFDARTDFDVIVIDTAPTGHALRLLELPRTAREWTQALMRVLMKYRALVRPGHLAAELVDLAKSVRELQAVLRDASQTRFVAVMRAAELPRAETLRLASRLRRLKLSMPAVVVNAMTLAPGACRRCRAIARSERQVMRALPSAWAIIQTPLSAPPPRGVAALEHWAGAWHQAARSRDRSI